MTLYSFLPSCFAQRSDALHLSLCEHDNHNKPNVNVDVWELLILLQRIIIILYKIFKKFKILKLIKTLI
jgi:hypothetical protein